MPTNRKAIALGAVALVASAVAARLVLLFERPLWHDELFTLWAARLPAAELVRALAEDSGPPLFYLASRSLAAAADFAGFDPLIRLLSFLATILIFGGALRLAGAASRFAFVALAASSPLLLVYAAEARAYALLSLLVLVLFLRGLLVEGRGSPGTWLLTALACAAALWTHYLAIFVVAAATLWLALRRSWRPVGALLAGGVLFFPWLPVLENQPAEATAWMREDFVASLYGLFAALGGSGRIPAPLGGPLPAWLPAAGAVVGLALAVVLAREASTGRDSGMRDALAIAAITMVLIGGASAVRPVAFAGRSEMAILPVWLYALARGASASRAARWLSAAAVALGLVSSAWLVSLRREEPVSQTATAGIVKAALPGDAVIATGAFYLPARLARDRGELKGSLTALPGELAVHPGWIPARPLSDADYTDLAKALDELPPGRRAFLLTHPILATPRLFALLEARGLVTRLVDRPDALVLGTVMKP